jgi:hypothetical protein
VAVRVIRSRIERPGFRTQEVLIATSLLDPQRYPASEITEAYLRRWRIELSFRDIKTSMEMEHLRAQSPEIAIKELLAGLVAYNLVRVTMIEAASRHGTQLNRLSFKGTVDGLRQYCPRMARARSQTALQRLRRGLFRAVAEAVEEAIVNSMTAAETMQGKAGTIVHALPLDRLVEVMALYGRGPEADRAGA